MHPVPAGCPGGEQEAVGTQLLSLGLPVHPPPPRLLESGRLRPGFAKLSWGRGEVRATILGTQRPYGGRNQDLWPFELEDYLKVY